MSTTARPALFAVEREARWRIWALFGLLLLVIWIAMLPISLAFLEVSMTYEVETPDHLSHTHPLHVPWLWLALATAALALLLGVVVAGVAWVASRRNARERLLATLRAQPLDPDDGYHQRLANIVDELRVAAGLAALDCFTVPALAMNAFSFSSGSGPACVGVTEGALSRLSRPQLQGVVAHEVAHVASRDCVTATRACLLFLGVSRFDEVKNQGLLDVGIIALVDPVTWLIALPLLVVGLWLHLMRLAAGVVNQAISRQREFAADLASARFTRDPVSLAEALEMMGQHRGSAAPLPARLSLLFFSPTQVRGVESGGGWRSTHPPLAARINNLLSLANAASADEGERAAEIARRQHSREHVTLPPGPRSETVAGLAAGAVTTHAGCPDCGQALQRVTYEGTSILACPGCGGRAVTHGQVEAILARREMGFTPEQHRLADLLEEEQRRYANLFVGPLRAWQKGPGSPLLQPKVTPIACPGCRTTMTRGVWNAVFPIAVDRCQACGLVWFDRDELEVLQILIERRTS
jgi:heat shock protein HtpX